MIYITALLFIKEGQETAFHEYENAVLPILQAYNGTLIHRIRPTSDSYIGTSTEEQPYEIHLISFPTEEDFKSYLLDPKRSSFNELKEKAIEYSLVYKGMKI